MQVAALLFWINQPSMPKAALLEDIRKAGASLLPSCSARYWLQGNFSPTPTCKQRQICVLLSALEYFLSGHGVDRLAHCLAFLSQLFLHLFKGTEGGRLPAQSCSLLSFSFSFFLLSPNFFWWQEISILCLLLIFEWRSSCVCLSSFHLYGALLILCQYSL